MFEETDPHPAHPWRALEACSTGRLAGLISGNHVELLERETRVLLLAAAWADRHDRDSGSGEYQPLVEWACAWGGPGTPEVSEYCAAELGALQGTGVMSARLLIADALDLRHRLPRLWGQVQAGQVRAWQARKIAETTRALSWAAARELDQCVSGFVGMLPWGRFQKVLAAAVLAADPQLAAEREQRARTERAVWATDSEDGLKVLVARASSGDVTWFLATVNRIAEILHIEGDTAEVGVRRSKAIGILAQPARALRLLIRHQHDPSTVPEPSNRHDEPEEGEEEEGGVNVAGPASRGGLDLTGPAAGVDLRAARPRVVLHFHLSDASVQDGHGLVRPEHGDLLEVVNLSV